MISKYEKTNGVKLLAAVMVLAMVFAGVAVMCDSEVNAAETSGPLNFSGAVHGFDSSKETNGFDGSALTATNTGLGNKIDAPCDDTGAVPNYTISGTVAYQTIAYDGKDWTGTQSDSAKAFYSNYVTYKTNSAFYGIVFTTTEDVSVSKTDANGETKDTEWILYPTTFSETYYVYDKAGEKLCTIGFSKDISATAAVNDGAGLKAAMSADKVKSVTLNADVTLTEALTVNKNLTVNSGKAITVTDTLTVTISPGAYFTGTITGNNEDTPGSATFTNITAAESKTVTIKSGSIEIDGQPTSATNGRISVTGEAKVTGTVDEGVTLSIEEDANANLSKLTGNKGTIEIYGAANIGDKKIAGKIVVDSAASITGTFAPGATIVPDADMEKPFYIGGILEESQPVNNATLNESLTIPEGITLTVNGDLFLNGQNIIVNGTLVVSNNACIYNVGTTGAIKLGAEGAIQNNGVIGNGNAVTVAVDDGNGAASTTSLVSMQGVSGLEFSVTKVESKNTLTIAGDVSRISSVAKNEFTATGVVIGDLTVGKNVTMNVTGSLNVAKNSAVVINGTVNKSGDSDASIVLDNGSSVSVNGPVKEVTISVTTGIVGTGSNVTYDKGATEFTFGNGTDKTNAAGVTISAGRITVANDDGKTSTIYQVAYINGTLKTIEAIVNDTEGKTSQAMGIEGDYYIAADNTLTISKDIVFTQTSATMIVYGTVVDQSNKTNLSYEGAKYTITTEGENSSETEVTYYTTFDAAMGVIDTVDDKTIEANVEKIGTNFTVGAGQTVEMVGSTVVVSSGATVTVEAEGSLTGITKVEGMVVVKDGGDCSIPRGGYAVRSVSADNTVTYAGLKVAISNAQPGDVIEIGTGSTSESLTIPQGVTVTVKESLTIGGDLTVAQGAKLDVRGTLTFEKTNAKVTVNGELDVSKGTIGGETYNLTSTGTSTFQSGSAPATYNGAKYTYNGNDVITSVTNAVSFAAENDIPSVDVNGIFTETSDIAIDGVNVNILTDAEITLGNVSIKDATINNDGELTAVITGYTGDGTATAVVELSGSAADVSCTSLIDAAGATTYTTYIDSYSGTMEIVSGTVVLDAENEVAVSADASSADMFTVAAGANLKTDVNATFSGKNVRINGTLDIQSTVSFTDMTVAGTVAVNKNGVLNIEAGVVVTGSIIVSDVENEEGTLNINETVRVGETPKTLGATTGSIVGEATLASNMYIYVYPGASIAEAVINADSAGNSTAKSTAFYVNDVLYATVYAISGTVSGSEINTEIGNLEDVKTSAKDIKWTSDGQDVENGVAIGRYAELRAEVEYESVTIVVSAGPGLEIYIDDVKDKSSLTVGEHTVVVYVKSGYEGTPSITFNGQAVTDGKIVITADMIDQNVVLAATGATPIDYSQSGSSDGGFGLVEILLIILVILIVVMAIMVALRLMRS